MSYFDGIKVGDRVWDFVNLWGIVIEVKEDTIHVDFDNGAGNTFTFDGKTLYGNNPRRQQLFWDEIKFETPQKPKIELKEKRYAINLVLLSTPDENSCVYNMCVSATSQSTGLFRDNKEIAEKALKSIKRFSRLLALRDQECESSRGYEFRELHGRTNYYIVKNLDHNYWVIGNANTYNYYMPGVVYFKTKEDAELICNILNSGRFNLEGG